jgi:transcriptional regulator with XRE-family HTH domain
MVHEASVDGGFAAAYERRLSERRIIKDLMIRRATSGLSQKDIARSFGCTQSRISKLENMTDSELKLGDLAKYSRALGLQLRITFAPNDSTPAARNGSIAIEICADDRRRPSTASTRASAR